MKPMPSSALSSATGFALPMMKCTLQHAPSPGRSTTSISHLNSPSLQKKILRAHCTSVTTLGTINCAESSKWTPANLTRCFPRPDNQPSRMQGSRFCTRKPIPESSRVQECLFCTRNPFPELYGGTSPHTLPKNLSGIRTSSRIPAMEGLFQAQGGRMRDWRRRARGVQASQSRTGRWLTVRKRR